MDRDDQTAARPLGWTELAAQIGDFLDRAGLPPREVDRLRRAVIRDCAETAETLNRRALAQHAMAEARTLLEDWRATRRDRPPGPEPAGSAQAIPIGSRRTSTATERGSSGYSLPAA